MRRPILAGIVLSVALTGVAIIAVWRQAGRSQTPEQFGFGTPATTEEIRQADTDVTPDGGGLPRGSGTVAEGETIYKVRCSGCHGVTGTEGPFDRLVGREPGDTFNFGRDPKFLGRRTVGNYWPYAPTLYDYVNRAMPFDAPGSLSSDEVYSVVAYLLYRNQIVPADAAISDRTLPLVRMPARDRFVVDNRSGGRIIR
ncbi:MAG: cytochrome c [Anaerolineae bacterium]|nr:cytochrome c [Gemmatimonadaceae bacterium]